MSLQHSQSKNSINLILNHTYKQLNAKSFQIYNNFDDILTVLPVHHVQPLQVSQGLADLLAVLGQCRCGQDVLLFDEIAPQLTEKIK